jgi:hypothetical protein
MLDRSLLRLVTVAVATLAPAAAAAGGEPAQVAAESDAPEGSTLAAPLAERPAPYVLPPPPGPGDLGADQGLHPFLDRPDAPRPGPYFHFETDILAVHLRNQFIDSNLVVNSSRIDTIQFPGNRLYATLAPRFDFGYALPDGFGSLQLGYRFLTTEGSDVVKPDQSSLADPLPGHAGQHGRLRFDLVDADYISREFSLGPCWEMRWGAGLRFYRLYFDSSLTFIDPASDPGTPLVQSEANSLWGLNAHGLLEVDWRTPIRGLAVFGRAEGSAGYARITQTATEALVAAPDGSIPGLVRDRLTSSVGIPTLAEEVGLSYTVPRWNCSRILAGYQYETWWQIGRLNNSRGQLDVQGLFLRCEINF